MCMCVWLRTVFVHSICVWFHKVFFISISFYITYHLFFYSLLSFPYFINRPHFVPHTHTGSIQFMLLIYRSTFSFFRIYSVREFSGVCECIEIQWNNFLSNWYKSTNYGYEFNVWGRSDSLLQNFNGSYLNFRNNLLFYFCRATKLPSFKKWIRNKTEKFYVEDD